VYHNHGQKITAKPIRKFFTNLWPNGLISNFKRIGRRFRPIPNLIVIVVNENTKRFAIETELLRAKINSFFVTSTNNNYAGLYNIFGNNDSPRSADLLNDLLTRSMTVGFLQETSRVKIRRRFPRLGSNQRPRT
jgi:ribosomal protein S2